ncbi:MAG: Holliday junction resolvase RuvX [Chlamydiia bacterium]|nr:Holliday junction resolvase RuvX [Chlamydiia bacterium]
MPRVAAIDFGLKRIGIALSDTLKMLASPFAVVPGGKEAVQNVISALQPKIQEIEKILIGLPLLLSGEKGEMALAAEQFGKDLGNALRIPIEFVDERLSSKQVDKAMQALPLSRKERSAKIDTGAAALILQTYLDKKPPL